MEKQQTSNSRKQRRALSKKIRRKKIRQKAAKERDRQLEEEEIAKCKDPAYQEWLEQQNVFQEFQRKAEALHQQEQEEQWLRRELVAQQQFRVERKRQEAVEAVRETERLQKEKEYEEEQAQKRHKREAKQRLVTEAADAFERMLERMEEYLVDPEMDAPPELRRYVETHPGRDVCQFYERTNCCRFGLPCVHNHRRPMLSKILLIRHFFTHSQLEHADHEEYGTDVLLEFSDGDIRRAYEEFFGDVVPELESFGKIVNFRTVSNAHVHQRGHVFVEYTTERAALNAFIKLQGRYYATRRLSVEFSNIVVWRTAICGLSFIRKCPQGRKCLYLHLFSNPDNKYNTLLELTKTGLARLPPSLRVVTPLISWNDLGKTPSNATPNSSEHESRSWRWSESPEVEIKSIKNDDVVDVSEHKGSHNANKESTNCSRQTRRRSRSRERRSNDNQKRRHSRSRSQSRDQKHSRHRGKERARSRERNAVTKVKSNRSRN